MEIIAAHGASFIAIAVIFGLFMTWGIGANDVANAMGTSVGSGAITVRMAIIIAAVFEFLGVTLAGGNVTRTIRKGIIRFFGLFGLFARGRIRLAGGLGGQGRVHARRRRYGGLFSGRLGHRSRLFGGWFGWRGRRRRRRL